MRVLSGNQYNLNMVIRAPGGAGGLGMQMEISMKMFAGGEVVSFLFAFLALVWLADLVSKWLRAWIE